MTNKTHLQYCYICLIFFLWVSNAFAVSVLSIKVEYDNDANGSIDSILYTIYGEECTMTEMRTDNDGDGVYDSISYMSYDTDGYTQITRQDLDADGTIDQVLYYKQELGTGEDIIITEEDSDADGSIDSFSYSVYTYNASSAILKKYEGDGSYVAGGGTMTRVNYYTFDSYGNEVKKELDSDADGVIDEITYTTYENCMAILTETDLDNDGEIEQVLQSTYDDKCRPVREELDSQFVSSGIEVESNNIYEFTYTDDEYGSPVKLETNLTISQTMMGQTINQESSIIAYTTYEYGQGDCWSTSDCPICAQNPEDTSTSIYFSHVSAKSPWQTQICIINTDTENSLTGDFICCDNSGTELETLSVTLEPNGRKEIDIASEFSNQNSIGFIIFTGNSDQIKGYTKFYQENKYGAAIPACSDINSGDIYIPHIASNSKWWTGISLFNTTLEDKTLTFEFNDGTTKTKTMSPKEHQVYTVKSLFNGVAQPNIKSAILKDSDGIVGLELFGSTDTCDNSYLSGVLLKDDTSSTIYYPHIASNDTWWTGIVAYNPSSSSTDLTITPYQSDGTALPQTSITLDAQEKYIGSADALNLPEGSAWFKINATQPIVGFELFGTNNGNQLAGYTGVGINGSSGVFPKNETSDGWTGITFVNTTDNSSTLTLNAFNDNGDLISTNSIDLAPYEKKVSLSPNLFSGDISTATYISYSSDSEVVGFQLNGSADNMILDALPGM